MNAVPTWRMQCPHGPEEGSGLLELKLKAAVSHPLWVLRPELRSSGIAIQNCNH